jgi:hypothetical protein
MKNFTLVELRLLQFKPETQFLNLKKFRQFEVNPEPAPPVA